MEFNGKTYRNLESQVAYLTDVWNNQVALNEMGIKVVGHANYAAELPTTTDFEFGDAYMVGTETPYDMYVWTRADLSHTEDYWCNVGKFPCPGPQGPKGDDGAKMTSMGDPNVVSATYNPLDGINTITEYQTGYEDESTGEITVRNILPLTFNSNDFTTTATAEPYTVVAQLNHNKLATKYLTVPSTNNTVKAKTTSGQIDLPYTEANTAGTLVLRNTDGYIAVGGLSSSTTYSPAYNICSAGNAMADNAGCHNSIYRGQYLGDSVTTTQWASIKAGTFEDLYIGDYWTINGNNWRIAAFDYYLNCGDTVTTDHHVVIVPDSIISRSVMNETATTEGAYLGSYMRQTTLPTVTAHNDAFGSEHILSHRIRCANAMNADVPSSTAWVDSTLDLMTEIMVYGCPIFTRYYNSGTGSWHACERSQLPLFNHNPTEICRREMYWLRDTSSITTFCLSDGAGYATSTSALGNYGIRPFFCIYQA